MEEVMTILNGMTNPKPNITQVINIYSKRLMGFIRKRVDTEADAEDILQDVFYQLIGSTRPIEQLTSWLFTVARNKITDSRRKKQPEALEEMLTAEDGENFFEWSEALFENADNPETAYLRNLFWETLAMALNELPPEQKDVFILHEMEGIPFKVIAAQTGETVNTLLSRK
jgi:RNA polymerase sigma factor (sigma-70 family)